MTRILFATRWLLALCLLLAVPRLAHAQAIWAQEPQSAPAIPAHEYRARAMAALDAGEPQLAGQILMLSYQDHGDIHALYIAGIAFARAGNRDMAWQVWSLFLCKTNNRERRRDVRLSLHELLPGRAARPCLQTRQGMEVEAAPRKEPRVDFVKSAAEFELEAGIMGGDDAFAFTWGPGFWTGDRSRTHFGLFVPITLGPKLHNEVSIGLQPRVRIPVAKATSLEFGAGIHTGDDWNYYSLSAGVNLGEILTLGLSHESIGNDEFYDYNNTAQANSATFLSAAFTGKAGKVTTAIEAGLLIFIAGVALSD